MSISDESPRIGRDEVEAEALIGEGRPLTELVAELGAERVIDAVEGMPGDGWRVLRRFSPEWVVIGAPVPGDKAGRWQLGRLEQASSFDDEDPVAAGLVVVGLVVVIDREPEPVDPSRAERRRALELRWPDGGGLPTAIDVVNRLGEPLRLWERELEVIGVLTAPGTTEFSFGHTSYGMHGSAVALPPGGSVRVPVRVLTASGAQLAPGSFELHPVLVDSGLTAPAAPLVITPAVLAQLQLRP